ncbi:MAG: hypothetical protein OEW97_06990 [Gammaproteobacteria bacterium]|nr:hypothetical protein [Gammaproteobacteria bacterium]
MEAVTGSVYGHSILLICCLFLIAAFNKFKHGAVLDHGIYLLLLWMLVEVFFTLQAEDYGHYIGELTVSFLTIYSLYWVLLLISEKVTKPENSDGSIERLIPLFIYPMFIMLSLMLKGIVVVLGQAFSFA